ncbi:hypothetical protein ACFQ9X_33600 [Catenulispora yoronensis]
MDAFLGELGKKLADHWFTLLVLPGALYLAVAAAADALGQAHALDPARLARRVTAWSKAPDATAVGGQIIVLAAVLAGAGMAGLSAQAAGRAFERIALAADWTDWPRPLRVVADRFVARRRERWNAANADYQRLREQARRARARGERLEPMERDRAYRALIRVSEGRPERPTWSGDRIHAVGRRLHDDLGLDTVRIWPALWLILPDAVRSEITAARTDLAAAATLTGWAVLYVPIAVWWWPAALIAVVLTAPAARIRITTNTYALLIESAARLHTSALADQLRLPADGPATVGTGQAITSQLSAHASDPLSGT